MFVCQDIAYCPVPVYSFDVVNMNDPLGAADTKKGWEHVQEGMHSFTRQLPVTVAFCLLSDGPCWAICGGQYLHVQI